MLGARLGGRRVRIVRGINKPRCFGGGCSGTHVLGPSISFILGFRGLGFKEA